MSGHGLVPGSRRRGRLSTGRPAATRRPRAVGRRRRCPGSGEAAVAVEGSVYPACPRCGRQFAAAGRKARARLGNPWRDGVPVHYVRG